MGERVSPYLDVESSREIALTAWYQSRDRGMNLFSFLFFWPNITVYVYAARGYS